MLGADRENVFILKTKTYIALIVGQTPWRLFLYQLMHTEPTIIFVLFNYHFKRATLLAWEQLDLLLYQFVPLLQLSLFDLQSSILDSKIKVFKQHRMLSLALICLIVVLDILFGFLQNYLQSLIIWFLSKVPTQTILPFNIWTLFSCRIIALAKTWENFAVGVNLLWFPPKLLFWPWHAVLVENKLLVLFSFFFPLGRQWKHLNHHLLAILLPFDLALDQAANLNCYSSSDLIGFNPLKILVRL